MTDRLFLRLDGDPLYAPETSVPAGALRELALPAALRPHVAHLLAYREELPAGLTLRERVLPDGALRLIVEDLDDGPRLILAGPSTQPVLLQLSGRQHGLSLTLRPGAAQALLGLPAHELAERVLPWDAVVAPRWRDLAERLQARRGDAARARCLLQTLEAMRRDGAAPDPRPVLAAGRLFEQGQGRRSVAEVARQLGLGERRLQQVFRAQMGLTPAAFGRLARLHACLRLLRRPAARPPRWPELALEAGFYDQSHLIREFRALCGLTPQQYLDEARAPAVSDLSKTRA